MGEERVPDGGSAVPMLTGSMLKGIAEISMAIMEHNYLDDLLALIVSITAKVIGSKICSILMIDKDKKELVLRACHSDTGTYRQRTNTPLGQGIAGRVAVTNAPIKVLDVRKDPRFLNKQIAEEDGLVSLLSVPMSLQGEVIGVINCYTVAPYDFSPEDIMMLTTVAAQAAVLLKNTELRIMKEIIERELNERKTIERAKEILMEKKKISGKQAFELMRRQSMNSRISMAKIAESVLLASTLD
jgi:signal transduction protein with GAF and PtsI domain